MNGIYKILDTLKTEIEKNDLVKTISFGDFYDLDLNKTTLYSIAHINLGNISLNEQYTTYNISIIFTDIVDVNKEDTDVFYVSNIQDIINTQYGIASILVQSLRRGDLRSDGFELIGTPILEPFKERFDKVLAGVVLSFDIGMKNDITIC